MLVSAQPSEFLPCVLQVLVENISPRVIYGESPELDILTWPPIVEAR